MKNTIYKLETGITGKLHSQLRLHYIIKIDTGQHYKLAFDQEQSDWLLIKTVDDARIGSR
jgi:hypothetical protein